MGRVQGNGDQVGVVVLENLLADKDIALHLGQGKGILADGLGVVKVGLGVQIQNVLAQGVQLTDGTWPQHDDGIGQEVSQGQLVLASQRMAVADRDANGRLKKLQELPAVLPGDVAVEGFQQVAFVAQDVQIHLAEVGDQIGNLKLEIQPVLADGRHDIDKDPRAENRRSPDTNGPLAGFLNLLGFFQGLVRQGDDLLGVLIEGLASGRQADPAIAPLKNGDAAAFLEEVNLLDYGGRGDEEALGGLAKGPTVGHADEGFHLLDVHGLSFLYVNALILPGFLYKV